MARFYDMPVYLWVPIYKWHWTELVISHIACVVLQPEYSWLQSPVSDRSHTSQQINASTGRGSLSCASMGLKWSPLSKWTTSTVTVKTAQMNQVSVWRMHETSFAVMSECHIFVVEFTTDHVLSSDIFVPQSFADERCSINCRCSKQHCLYLHVLLFRLFYVIIYLHLLFNIMRDMFCKHKHPLKTLLWNSAPQQNPKE